MSKTFSRRLRHGDHLDDGRGPNLLDDHHLVPLAQLPLALPRANTTLRSELGSELIGFARSGTRPRWSKPCLAASPPPTPIECCSAGSSG